MPCGSCSGNETPHPPTIHWPELVTKPCPSRKYNPSMCPEIKNPGIIIKNMTATICSLNHQIYDLLSSCRQKAKHAHPLPREMIKCPSSHGLKLRVQDLWVIFANLYMRPGSILKTYTYPKHSFWCTPNVQLVWISSLFLHICPPFTSQCGKASHAVKSENKLQRKGR